ncbi:MAG: hypothetical protein K6C40_07710 [Thermoguttaceae bacterium]|nr:hypothetical protein [Thermoguttaceae bacterium]
MTRFRSLLTSFFLLAGTVLPLASVSAATISVDGETYTEENPYVISADSSDSYEFTKNGWVSISTAVKLNGSFSGAGNINAASSGRDQMHINGSMSDFSGTVNVSGQAWFTFNTSNFGSANADFIVDTTNANDSTGLLFYNITTTADTPIQIGSLAGSGCIRPMGNQHKNYHVEIGGSNHDAVFSGEIRTHNGDSVYVTKVGTGTWSLIRDDMEFGHPVTVRAGTLQIGNGGDHGKLKNTAEVVVEKNGTLQYNRQKNNDSSLSRDEKITLQGSTLKVIGGQKFTFTKLTVENGGNYSATTEGTIKDLVLKYVAPTTGTGTGGTETTGTETTEVQDVRFTIDGSGAPVNLTGTLTGGANQEIYFKSTRANFLNLKCTDVSGFSGTITAGPCTNPSTSASKYGTWIALDGSTTDFSTVTFNPNPGKISDGDVMEGGSIDAGFLLAFDPTNKVLQIGAISGDGVFRTDGAGNGKTVSIQVGAKNIDTTFSGSFSVYQNSNYTIEKVGTGTWTITSDYEKYYSGAPVGTNTKNNYTGTTTITGGTIQLGDGGTVGHLGTSTNSANLTKIVIGSAGTLAINRSGWLEFYNNIESSGTIKILGDTVALRGSVSGSITKTGSGILAIGNNNGANLTKITVKEGTLDSYAASRLGDGVTEIVLDGGTFRERTADVTLSNHFTISSASTIDIPEDFTTTISGSISNAAGQSPILTKIGTGTLKLTGSADNTANLTVQAGTLELAATGAAANDLTLGSGTTLNISGPNQNVTSLVTLNSGSEMNLTVTGTALPSLTAGEMDLKDGSKIEIEFSDSANPFAIGTLELLTADQFKVNGTPVTSEDSMQSLLDNFVRLNADWAELSFIPNGTTGYTVLLQTNFNALPEPSAWLLALLGFAGLGILRRRSFHRV